MFPRAGTPLSKYPHPLQQHHGRLPSITPHFRRIYLTSTLCNAAALPSRRPRVVDGSHAGTSAPVSPPQLRSRTEGPLVNTTHSRRLSSLSNPPLSLSGQIASRISHTQTSRRQAHATASPPGMYTTSFAFFEAMWEAGITHCFVNLGSDHPSIIEAMVKGQREKEGSFPRIITCPNEVSVEPPLTRTSRAT